MTVCEFEYFETKVFPCFRNAQNYAINMYDIRKIYDMGKKCLFFTLKTSPTDPRVIRY